MRRDLSGKKIPGSEQQVLRPLEENLTMRSRKSGE
jgi:hypothetical protein